MRVLWILTISLGLPSCFSPKYKNGDLKCDPHDAHPCPNGYYCASTNTCWQNDSIPPMSGDMGAGSSDMSSVTVTYPPSPLWFSSGGGSPTGPASGNQLNVSVGGTIATGSATGSATGQKLNLGYFPSDSIP